MRLHYRAWRAAPGPGLLPLHVTMISAAQLCLLTGAALGILVDLEDPLSYRTFFYVLGSVLTLIALTIIGRFQRRKLSGARRPRSKGTD